MANHKVLLSSLGPLHFSTQSKIHQLLHHLRTGAGFIGVHKLVQSRGALHLEGPSTWLNACCHHLEILNNF